MNTIMKSAIAAYGFLAAVSVPLTVWADTLVISGKDLVGSMEGGDDYNFLAANVFQYTTKSKGAQTGSATAAVFGRFRSPDTSCWYGFGSSDTIDFDAKGDNKVNASGSVDVEWRDRCGGQDPFTEKVEFYMNLRSNKDEVDCQRGTVQEDHGDMRVIRHYDSCFKSAEVDSSFILSPAFGEVPANSGYISRSKSHEVQITID